MGDVMCFAEGEASYVGDGVCFVEDRVCFVGDGEVLFVRDGVGLAEDCTLSFAVMVVDMLIDSTESKNNGFRK